MVDGQLVVPWQSEGNYTAPMATLPPRLKLPIEMEETGDQRMFVDVVSWPSLSVTEGLPLPQQPKFMVRYTNTGNPVKGVGCIAYLVGKGDDLYPAGYTLALNGDNLKYLVKPVAGNWSEDFADPFSPSIFTPFTTDENGTIRFEGLTISTQGNIEGRSAKYRVRVRCGGGLSPEFNITTTTSVGKLSLKKPLPSEFQGGRKNLYDVPTSLEIRTARGVPVAGKRVDNITVLGLRPITA